MKCRLCGGKLIKIEKVVEDVRIMSDTFEAGELHVSYCSECGLIQYEGPINQQALTSFYRSDRCKPMDFSAVLGEKIEEEYNLHLYNNICDYVDVNSYILDIGGAWGGFAKYMKSKGYRNYEIADPSMQCGRHLDEIGITHYSVDSCHLDEQIKNKYDLIILTHTLEHVDDLRSTMRQALELLNEKGYIYIDVPDVLEYEQLNRPPYYYLTLEHMIHFSMADLHNLGKEYGLEIIPLEKYVKVEDYPSICCLFKRGNRGDKEEITFHDDGVIAISEYLQESKRKLEKITKRYAECGEPLVLWGIGMSTIQLLKGFENCNVVQLIDSNKLRQGTVCSIGEKRFLIEDPAMLRDGKIVVLSHSYGKIIKQQIEAMKVNNTIDLLL